MDRRRFLALSSLGAVSLLGLSACGNSQASAPQASGPVRHVTDIEEYVSSVPESPQRIITLSEPTLDAVLALGVTPIGTVAGRGQQGAPSYLADRAQGIEIIGNVSQPNFEAIGAAQPDLILVDGTSINNNPPVIEALRQIAPVVYTGYAGGDWRTNLRHTADALNMVDAGEQLINDYESRAGELTIQLSTYEDQTFSIIRWQGNSVALILKELPSGRALTDVGLSRPPAQDRNGRGHSEPVSAENLNDIDADIMFFATLGGSSVGNPDAGGSADSASATDAILEAEKMPGFSDLKAYQNGNILPVDGAAWTSTGGPLLMNYILDDVERLLL